MSHRAQRTPTGQVNSMKSLQLSLHQHGASITIAVGLAKRANNHELRHLQAFIAAEMGEVKDIVHEATNAHKKVLHFPKIILSAREEFVRAQKEQRQIQWSTISRDDATVKTSQWYQDVQTPPTSPGPNTWWRDVSTAMEKREAAMAAGEATEPEPMSSKRKRAEVDGLTDESAMDVDEQSDDEGERPKKRKGKGKAAQMDANADEGERAQKSKGKGKAVQLDADAVEGQRTKKRKGKGKAAQMDADAAIMDGEADGPPSKQADDDETARTEKGKGRASDQRKLTPADDATMQPGQTSCTRCLRLGRRCTAIMGTVCTSCHQSKVSCPLFTGGKRARSRAPSRLSSVAPAVLPASEPGPSSTMTAPPTTTLPAGSAAVASTSASVRDNSGVPSELWDEDEAGSAPYRRVRTVFLSAMGHKACYRAPDTAAPPQQTKAQPMPMESDEKPVKMSRRGRSLSRPPARTPTVLSRPVRLQEPSQQRSKDKIILRIPSSHQSAGKSLPSESRRKMDRAPSAGPSSRQGRAKVFVDIPQISSLEEYSPLLIGDLPASVATKMAHLEKEITALKRAHEALRQYVISLQQHPPGNVLTHPPTDTLPPLGTDTFPRSTPNALTPLASGPLNGPAAPSAPQPLTEVVADLTTDGPAVAPMDPPTNADNSWVVEMVAADASADVEGGIAGADVEMAPAGDTLGPANSEAAPPQADRDPPTSLADLTVDSLPRPQTDGLAASPMDPPSHTDNELGVKMMAADVPVASAVVEGGIAGADVEMAPAGDTLGPANSEAAPADMPRDLGQADRDQPTSLEDADITAAAPNVNVEHRHRDHNASGAVEQVDKEAEATSGDVDMAVDPVAEESRDGEVGQAGRSVEATTTDIDMEAGQADVGVSLEHGQVPQDQLGPSTCMSPPVQAADPSL